MSQRDYEQAQDFSKTSVRLINKVMNRKWLTHISAFSYLTEYCGGIPPVIEPFDVKVGQRWDDENRFQKNKDRLKGVRWFERLNGSEPRPKMCVACGKIHVTSEDCPINDPRDQDREPTEFQTNRTIGTRLIDAAIMQRQEGWE